MAKIVEYTIPEEYFDKDQKQELEIRLAKLPVKNGDIIRFNEIDKRGSKTGRYFDRKVKGVHRVKNAIKKWSLEDIKKYGIYVLHLGDVK